MCAVQGIALSADPNYKVLGAAYPWIARRLLTEQSPELRDTLRTLLYKKGRFQVPYTPPPPPSLTLPGCPSHQGSPSLQRTMGTCTMVLSQFSQD